MLNPSQLFSIPSFFDDLLFQEKEQNTAIADAAAAEKALSYKSNRAKEKIKSILFMDDEKSLRTIVSLMLERLGYEAATAAHGSQALSLYESRMNSASPFDAVILDINIETGMNGIETIKKLLEIDPDVKAIGASGSITPESLKGLKQIGFTYVLAKPFRLKQLQEALDKTIVQPGSHF